MFLENMPVIANMVVGLFTFYNNCLTTVKCEFENYYNNNKNFRFLFDILRFFIFYLIRIHMITQLNHLVNTG